MSGEHFETYITIKVDKNDPVCYDITKTSTHVIIKKFQLFFSTHLVYNPFLSRRSQNEYLDHESWNG